MIVDYTMLGAFLHCPMQFKLFVLDGLVLKEKPAPLAFGGAIHLALSEWYRSSDKTKSLQAFKDNYVDLEGEGTRTLANGERLLREYFVKYAHEPFEVIYNERSFAAHLGEIVDRNYPYLKYEPITYAGRFDSIVRWGNYVYVLEHKTTSRLGYSYFEQFFPNIQLDGYAFLCRALIGKCDGAVVNALGVNKSTQAEREKGGTSNYYRHISSRTEKQLDAFQADTMRIVECIHHSTVYHAFYQNKTACSTWGMCSYRDICRANFDSRVIEMGYRKVKWNALLGRQEEMEGGENQ